MASDRTFVGFGLGAIQAGLFLDEAFRSGNFSRLVVAEIVGETVRAVRDADGEITVNSAGRDGIDPHRIEGVEIFNPHDTADREKLIDAVYEASEIATALPSVRFYDDTSGISVTDIIAAGLDRKRAAKTPVRCVIYTAENNNRAAEILQKTLVAKLPEPEAIFPDLCNCLNTVIGKMSRVVTDSDEIPASGLTPMTPGATRAYLVEAFNRIAISRIALPDFSRGIAIFEEKADLLPFEEAKLYGHNATHALIGYLARRAGATFIHDIRDDAFLMAFARDAFLLESGDALCRKYAGGDSLFTSDGYREYADDLLERMVNPYLRDTVSRVTRDSRRKLGWNDRLIGTIRLCLSQHVVPYRYAVGAAAALDVLRAESGPEPGFSATRPSPQTLLARLWNDDTPDPSEYDAVLAAVTLFCES